MKKLVLSLSLGVLVAASPWTNAADVTGTITFKGTPPAEHEYTPIANDPQCAALYPSGKFPFTEFYRVNSQDNGLADVVVYLKDADGKAITGKSTGASAPALELDQKGALYIPQILAVQTGQTVLVKNSDPFVHNVHDTPADNPGSNQVQMPNAPDLKYNFKNPEMFIKFQCDVHPWMFAWVSVFDHPYFDLSNTNGKFTIKNVPPGKYTLVADHRKLGTQTAEITVTDSGATHDFAFEKK